MAQPTNQQVHINAVLSNISVAYIQDADDFVAGKVFPVIPVDKKSDIYFKYNKDDWFRDEMQLRAPGTESAGSGYGLLTDQYLCKTWALHKDIDAETRENEDDPLDADTDASQWLAGRALLRQEVQWASDFFKSGVWGTDATSTVGGSGGVVGTTNTVKWSDYTNSDPIQDVAFAKKTIKTTTGKMPNILVLSFDVFTILQNHPKFIERIKYTSSDPIDTQIMARYFGLDEIIVCSAVINTAAEGATASYSFIQTNGALLMYRAPNPGVRVASAGYTFEWKGISGGLGLTTAVKKFPVLQLDVDRIEIQISYTNKVVAADLGFGWWSIV